MSDTKPSAEKPTSTWQDWATRTTAILAVIAALSSGRWGASNLQAILEQGKVNDGWSYYQADSIKEHGARQMKGVMEALGKGNVSEDQAKAFAKLQKDFAEEEAAKNKDKKARFDDAKKYEKSRDVMVERGFWYEVSFALLQLGVILCTIATASKTKGPFWLAIAIGILGFAVLINGFHRFYHAPASWYEGVSENMSYEAKPTTTAQ
jgi:hypothetical protein